ncbi:putative transcriptional regulator [Mycobacterium sp. JS623]|uniref:helix-turn-helix domain-containing protein n=1 Tax=Mycobacterium sp. JS623 TaxID=212767 RepID=UPI0002A55881|nr:helix-turn-helix transcriptional regulator [Mycobacterium sp. JS623]AGB22132.1 putative transcriptional regulator [Mycobacterium sp. JS623]
MTPEQTVHLINLLASKRAEAGLSTAEVARRAGVDVGTVWRIEQGQIANPRPESLQVIGEVLGIPASDLFATVGWVPPKELPTMRPYLRTKYRALPADARQEIEAHFNAVARKYGISFNQNEGPVDGEDE